MQENDFSFKDFFTPLTNVKALFWIIIVGLIVFGNMLFNGFVWDDITFIVNNPTVHSLNIASLLGHNAVNAGGFYRPLGAIYAALIYTIFGENAFVYHFFSLVIHLINVSLVFILFKRFFSRKLSLFLSLIFLVHPIQVESVSFISGTGDLLFFLFGISALTLSLKDNLSRKRLGLISLLLFLSIMLKETGFLFLPMIIFYRIIFKRKNIIPVLVSGTTTFLLYIVMRLGTGNVNAGRSVYAQIDVLPLVGRVLNIPAIIFYYLKILVYPANLAINQLWIVDKVNFSGFYFPLLIDFIFFGAIFLTGWFIRKNKKNLSIFLFFTLMFCMGLSLHLQIIPLDMTVSDRWFYFPFVGLLGMIAVVCSSIRLPGKNIRILFYAVGLLITILLSVRTMIRNTDWANDITLYAHDAKIYDNYQIEGNLGSEYLSQGNDKEFLYHTNRSINLFPNELSISNLAYFYLVHGEMEKARQNYNKALTYVIYPPEGHKIIVDEIYRGIAWSYVHSGQFAQARAFIKNVLPEYPTEDILWGDLAISEYKLGNNKEALIAAEKAKNLLQNAATNYIYNQILNNKPIKWN